MSKKPQQPKRPKKTLQPSPESFKRAGRIVLLSSVSILIAIVLGETVVRSVYGNKFGPRPGFYQGDNRLGWKPTPNLDHTFYGPDYDIHIRTDADGYRLGALGEVDYTKELVVLCGDSYAFGWGVSTDQTFASHLDGAIHEATSGRLRVVNLGVGGYGILQSCDRLAVFFDTHPQSRARAVLVQHTVNDAVDNYRAVGYHLGLWETEERGKKRSPVHVFNLAGYGLQAIKRGSRRGSADVNHPYVQDLLWAYQRKGREITYPERVEIAGRWVEFDRTTVKDDMDPEWLIQHEKLSRAHRDLMFESLNCLHQVCAAYRTTVVHVFTTTTPDWYAQQMTELIKESAEFRKCPAIIVGRVPRPGEFAGPISTGHSGGHFNGEFNRFWAEKMMAVLRDLGLN